MGHLAGGVGQALSGFQSLLTTERSFLQNTNFRNAEEQEHFEVQDNRIQEYVKLSKLLIFKVLVSSYDDHIDFNDDMYDASMVYN